MLGILAMVAGLMAVVVGVAGATHDGNGADVDTGFGCGVAPEMDRAGHLLNGGVTSDTHEVLNHGGFNELICNGSFGGHVPEMGVMVVSAGSPKAGLIGKGNKVATSSGDCGLLSGAVTDSWTKTYDTDGTMQMRCTAG